MNRKSRYACKNNHHINHNNNDHDHAFIPFHAVSEYQHPHFGLETSFPSCKNPSACPYRLLRPRQTRPVHPHQHTSHPHPPHDVHTRSSTEYIIHALIVYSFRLCPSGSPLTLQTRSLRVHGCITTGRHTRLCLPSLYPPQNQPPSKSTDRSHTVYESGEKGN